MQQRPEQRAVDSVRTQRTQPALPGVTQPTVPIVAPRQGFPPMRKTPIRWRTLFPLLGLGVLLELLYLALYPLLANMARSNVSAAQAQQVQQALPGLFPWLPFFYWTRAFPAIPQFLSHTPWLNITNGTTVNAANALFSVILLMLAGIVVLIATAVSKRAAQEQRTRVHGGLLFWAILLMTGLFSVTMLFAPVSLNLFSQDMISYGLYGRLVVVHHVNPYGVVPTIFPEDTLQSLLSAKSTTSYGPVWTDISVLIALFARESIANTLIGFRIIGLIAHLANAALLWVILARLKAETRLSATLLYAWNPLMLLFGIAEMHQEIVLVFIILLAILFFQRNSPTIGWVFVLLAALINLLWLPLLPLFFRFMLKQSRILRLGQRLLWWLGMVTISVIVVVLAYIPYWHALGIPGILRQLHDTFLPDNATNSLNAAFLSLPIKSQGMISWFTVPHHWAFLALLIMGLFLLFGLWLANTLELVVLFSGWLLLVLAILLPTYWPWYILAPFALALCSANRRVVMLAVLLTAGAFLSRYWLLVSNWSGQALVTVGLPLLLWGWILFFSATWQMTHASEEEREVRSRPSFSRPPWLSRPTRPGRRK